MRKAIKSVVAVAMALLLAAGGVLTAAAETYKNGETVVVVHDKVWAFHGGRVGAEITGGSTANGGNRGNHYNNRLYWYEGNSIDILTMSGSKYTPQYNGKVYLYCIHHGQGYGTANRVIEIAQNGNLTKSNYWKNLGRPKQELLKKLSLYGFPAQTPQQLGVNTVDDAYAATQVIAWEITQGYTAAGKSDLYKHYILYAYNGNGHSVGQQTPAYTAYINIWNAIARHSTVASFNNQTLTLRWDAAVKAYKGSITDTNGIVANSYVRGSLPAGITSSKSGNTVSFSTANPIGSTASVNYMKNLSEQLEKTAPYAVLEGGSGAQEMMCGTLADPVPFSVKLRTATGGLKIIKSSADGIVAGMKFRIQGNGLDQTVTTGKDGTISQTLPAGTYTVTEINVPDRYNAPASQTVTVADGQTATVSFYNGYKYGGVELHKTNDVGAALAGAVFGLYDAKDGAEIARLTTDAEGKAAKADLLPGEYYLQEITAPQGYVLDTEKHSVTVPGGQTVTVDLTNHPQTGRITVTKTDSETGKPVSKPAVFTVQNSAGQTVATLTTEGGTATTQTLPLGAYTVEEATAPDGYIQDGKTYEVTLSYGGQTVEIVTESVTIANMPQMGRITVTKADRETEKPVIQSSATFEVTAKTDIVTGDGTVRYTAGEVVDSITTSEGTATTKPLYLGTYVIRETTAPEGYVLDDATHDVTLTYGGQTVELVTESVTIANMPQMGKITVTKVDRETEKPVIQSDATFEVIAKTDVVTGDGTVRYAAGKVVDTITTNGGVATTKPLYLGSYTVREITAPDGYMLDDATHDVTLTYGGQTVELVNESVTVANMPQMGKITVTKVDRETEKPVIQSDATFEVIAKTDVVTGDGTVRYTAGEVVDTITTENGIATTKTLYLGSYTVKEITAPEGYVLDDAAHDVTLTYGGQTAELVTEGVTVANAPQMGKITVTKTDKETGKPVIQANAVFEVTAKEDIVTPDGTVRYTAGEVVDTITTEGGIAATKALYLGSYTVREITAPEGYVLDDAAHDITLTYGGQTAELVTEGVTVANAPQMGRITVRKVDGTTGKLITASSATFAVYAKEDIVTPDGTVRAKAGELVDTITTEGGIATTKPLYLGSYLIQETTAPEGYVLDKATYGAVLLYDNQLAQVRRLSAPAADGSTGGNATENGSGAASTVPVTDAETVLPENGRNNATVEVKNQPIPQSPKTGDTFPVLPLCSVLLISIVGATIGGKRRQKNK